MKRVMTPVRLVLFLFAFVFAADFAAGEDAQVLLFTPQGVPDARTHVLLQCTRTFPAKRKVSLIWGKGVTSTSGVATTQTQAFEFKSRGPFTATFRSTREHAKSGCIPMLPMSVDFSAPVSRDLARNVILRSGEKIYRPEKESGEEDTVTYLSFKGPFPEDAAFFVEMPKGIVDDSGRALENRARFPLAVRTGPYPPLAKFASRFGIIERKNALLPVTVRNIEPLLRGRTLGLLDEKSLTDKGADQLLEGAKQVIDGASSLSPQKGKEVMDGLKGRLRRPESDEEIIGWLRKVALAEREESLLKVEAKAKDFSLPRPNGLKTFEVVGTPLGKPGLYVVELESDILGASLLGKPKPMYVQTSALVTNLSAHLKPRIDLAAHVALYLLKPGMKQAASTLDGNLQSLALGLLKQYLTDLREQNVKDTAVLVLANRTGEVLAYAANAGFDPYASQVDGIRAKRQAGSTLKPFLYAMAIDRRLITAATLLEDRSIDLPTDAGIYRPENYDNRYRGQVPARVALASPLNMPAVRALLLTGTEPGITQYVKVWPLPRITYPPAGALISLDPDIPIPHQKIFFQASYSSNRVRWLLDGESVGEGAMLSWTSKRGQHRLHLLGTDDRTLDSVTFNVRD